MNQEDIDIKTLEKTTEELKKTLNDYFKLFLENYPLLTHNDSPFCPIDLHKLSIKAQCLLSSLGCKAKERLNYLGFNELFPADNPVDWYNWKSMIKEKQIDHTVYTSIIIRIEAEIERILFFLSNNRWDTYLNLSESEYLVSKERYKKLFPENNPKKSKLNNDTDNIQKQNINIENLNVSLTNEKEAVSILDKLHKKTGTISNIVNILSKLLSI